MQYQEILFVTLQRFQREMTTAIRDREKSGNGIETEKLKQMNYLV